jgi:hypothetical protein
MTAAAGHPPAPARVAAHHSPLTMWWRATTTIVSTVARFAGEAVPGASAVAIGVLITVTIAVPTAV